MLLTACGIGGSVDEKVAAAQSRNDGPPIWIVKDEDSTLYLYGTVHLLSEDMDWQREDMKAAFGEAGTIYFEIDTADTAQLELSVLTQTLGFFQNGETLTDHMDNYQLNLFEAVVHNGKLTRELLKGMKPWLASELLTVSAANEAGLFSDFAADETLKMQAQHLGKNIIYLDTIKRQIHASADQSRDVQMTLLTETMANYSQLGQNLSDIADAWAVGNAKELERVALEPFQLSSSEFYQALRVDRNHLWVSEFENFMNRSGTAFAAIGIAHLLGEDSLQDILRENGYGVERYYAFQGENVIKSALE